MDYRKLSIVFVFSWILAVIAFLLSQYFIDGRVAEGGDVMSVTFWSLAALLLSLLLYLPAMILLRKFLHGCKPVFAFPVIATLASVFPTAFIIWMNSTNGSNVLRGLFSAEAILFYCMFIVFGVSFGLGFAWCCRKVSYSSN